MRQDACPQCGSATEVRTVQELVDMLGQMRESAMARYQQSRLAGPRAGSRTGDNDPYETDPDQMIANLVLSEAGRLIGRAIGKRVRRTFENRVMPAVESNYEQGRREQLAIAERYPDLRACLRDNVVFLAGGTRVVPLADVANDITLAHADAVVATLRTP